ncbi:glycosyltransferase 87 family protein [Larkinella sp. VNQ87]|uniref:glycosyltransferase 87 family protein n=1 Tax=Larkinella sp. VNQ87 TaxID=3400921 RepID=UPI003C041494
MIGKTAGLTKLRDRFWVGIAVVLGILLLVYALGMWPRKAVSQRADLHLYYSVSGQLVAGKLPYRDFSLEYPPLVLVPLVIPHLILPGKPVSYPTYVWLYTVTGLLTVALLGWLLWLLAKTWPGIRSVRPILTVYLLLVLLNRDFIFWRYDLFPALLTFLAFRAVVHQKPLRAGFWLGLAVLAKLYPVILAPVLGLYYLLSNQYRAGIRFLAGTGLTLSLVLLPLLWASDNQILRFLTYHQARGLQIESVAAGLLLLWQLPDLKAVSTEFNYGAFHLIAAGTNAVLTVLPGLFLAGFSGLLLLCAKRFQSEVRQAGAISAENLLRFLVAALLVFIGANKVFSPQYLVWLLPFVPFLSIGQFGVFVGILMLTNLIYPVFYSKLIDPTPIGIGLLNLRNLLLLGWLVSLLMKKAPGDHQRPNELWREPDQGSIPDTAQPPL